MNVFDLNKALIGKYEEFAQSFTKIRAAVLRAAIDEIYVGRWFDPTPPSKLSIFSNREEPRVPENAKTEYDVAQSLSLVAEKRGDLGRHNRMLNDLTVLISELSRGRPAIVHC